MLTHGNGILCSGLQLLRDRLRRERVGGASTAGPTVSGRPEEATAKRRTTTGDLPTDGERPTRFPRPRAEAGNRASPWREPREERARPWLMGPSGVPVIGSRMERHFVD